MFYEHNTRSACVTSLCTYSSTFFCNETASCTIQIIYDGSSSPAIHKLQHFVLCILSGCDIIDEKHNGVRVFGDVPYVYVLYRSAVC